MGWRDTDWLEYLLNKAADERTLPKGMPSTILDKGHAGKRLDDFVSHPDARAAKLQRAHVLALRLYSCSVYRSIVDPLRNGCSPERPHPYPVTVAFLTEAIKELRTKGNNHYKAKEFAEALECYNEVFEKDPAQVSVLNNKAGESFRCFRDELCDVTNLHRL